MSEYCKYCGQEYRDAATLLRNTCNHHPNGRACSAKAILKPGERKMRTGLFALISLGAFTALATEYTYTDPVF